MTIAFVTILVLQGAAGPADAPSSGPQPAIAAPESASPGAAPAAEAPPAPPAPPAAAVAAVAAPAAAPPAEQVREQPRTRELGTFSDEQIRWINRRWSGVGVGFDNGLWGGKYGQSIKVSIPFGRNIGRFFGMRVRGMLVHHVDEVADQFDPVVNVGGELFGRSPVWWGVLRVYGGGGLWAGIRPNPTGGGSRYGLGGGGFVGLEAFVARFMAFTFEVGGQAPGHGRGVDRGGSVMGGMMFYFGRTETRWSQQR